MFFSIFKFSYDKQEFIINLELEFYDCWVLQHHYLFGREYILLWHFLFQTNSTLKFPGNLQELQDTAQLIRLYYEVNWVYVLVLYSSAYIYKQTFAIPGTVFLVSFISRCDHRICFLSMTSCLYYW